MDGVNFRKADHLPKVGEFRIDRWGFRKDVIFISMRMRDSSEYTGIRVYYKKRIGTVGIEE